jgi:hypothetical protein
VGGWPRTGIQATMLFNSYLVSIGRGQSDENWIVEVEHEKEKEEETVLKGA